MDNMTNLEIKENIVLHNMKQLKNIKNASYLNIFNIIISLKEILEHKEEIDDSRFNGESELLNRYVDMIINSVMESMSDMGEKNLKLEDSIEIRKELWELLGIAEGYLIELSFVGEFVDQYGIKILSKKDHNNKIYDSKNVDELKVIIEKILIESKDDFKKYIYIISRIISIVPMRLVKDNYYDIIQKTLIRNFQRYTKPQIENKLNDYKKQFDSSTRDGYGTKFDYYFREIQKMKRIDLKNKTLDELSTMVNEVVKITKEINELLDFIFRLGLLSNMNIVITLTDKIPNSFEIEDIYDQWMKILKNKDKKEIKEFKLMLENEIGKVEENIFKDLNEFENLNMEALNREDFDYEELNEELTYAKEVLTYYNDNNFSAANILFPSQEEITDRVDLEYLEQISDSLIQYINRSIFNMNNVERRTRMRKLLSLIELPFGGIEDFSKYISYSLDSKILPKEEINFIVGQVLYFLNEISKSE